MVSGDLDVEQVLAVLDRLHGGGIEIREVVQVLCVPFVADAEIPAMGLNELITDGVQRDRVLRIAVGDVVVTVRDGDITEGEALLLLYGSVMRGEQLFQKPSDRAGEGIRFLYRILQISEAARKARTFRSV